MKNLWLPAACLFLLCSLAAACTMQNPATAPSGPAALTRPALSGPAGANAEAAAARLRRLRRLAASLAPTSPTVEQVFAAADIGPAVPVLRVVFPDRVLVDGDGNLVDSWLGFGRLSIATLQGSFRCTGTGADARCRLTATTARGIATESSSETLDLGGNERKGLSGSLGVKGALTFPLTASHTGN